MINLRTTLANDIAEGISAAVDAGTLGKEALEVAPVVERPDDPERGDFASPTALVLTKKLGTPPMEIMEAIVEHMPKREYLGKVEGVGPGFLNIRINPGWLTARLDDIVEQADLCSDISSGAGKSINLEFISANPTGPLTMGNLRNGFSADTLANVLSCAGWSVTREFYLNDAGVQVARLSESIVRRMLQAAGHDIEFPEEMYQGEYIKEVAATIAEELRENEGQEVAPDDLDDDELLERISRLAVQRLHAANQKTIEEDLKITFDIWTSEHELRTGGAVEEAMKELEKKGVTYDKEGATWLKASEAGTDEDYVLVKKDGEYAYLAPDIANNIAKEQREFDLIVTYLGADHLDHPPRIRAAMQLLGYDVDRWQFPICQMFRLVRDGKPVKLSKRAGAVSTVTELIEEVGYDVARYFFVMQKLNTHMDFDLDLAKEQSERNPVYYVQYAYVRLQSILRKAKEEGAITGSGEDIQLHSDATLTDTTELALLQQLYRFPEVVEDVADTHEVHRLPYYAHDIARAVHAFYHHVPVLRSEDQKLLESRLQLVIAARNVLGKTLDLLGISKPDVM